MTKQQLEKKIDEILTELWDTVDIQDVEEKLIDIGAIDDAQQAILHLIDEYCKSLKEDNNASDS